MRNICIFYYSYIWSFFFFYSFIRYLIFFVQVCCDRITINLIILITVEGYITWEESQVEEIYEVFRLSSFKRDLANQ